MKADADVETALGGAPGEIVEAEYERVGALKFDEGILGAEENGPVLAGALDLFGGVGTKGG
jgi:hypothetical protein